MMDDNRLHALQQRHAGLDRKIQEEERRPSPDFAVLADLKKQKLRLKEAIHIR